MATGRQQHNQRWLYLTTIMDLGRRSINRQMIFPSDRGIQYCCQEFKNLLETQPLVRQSMSRKGNCWDNAPTESFFNTFKEELPIEPKHYNYKSFRQAIFNFIETWYNRQRLHSTMVYRTPSEMQYYLAQRQELAA